MKNFLILGLTALLMFSLSAALSLWLNQGRWPSDTSPSTEKAGKKAVEKEPGESRPPAKSDPKGDHKDVGATASDPSSLAALREREARLERRATQIDLVLRDIQSQREVVDTLLRQVSAELKTVGSKVSDLDVRAAELDKKKLEFDAIERKNIERMAGMYDAMAPESAAKIIQQMVDSGRLDTAAKTLSLMKDRNSARLLSELDPALAAQLLDKMRGLRSAPIAPIPKTGGTSGTIPAGGVTRP